MEAASMNRPAWARAAARFPSTLRSRRTQFFWPMALHRALGAPALSRALCPRGAIDLAVAYHRRGDQSMIADLAAADLLHLY